MGFNLFTRNFTIDFDKVKIQEVSQSFNSYFKKQLIEFKNIKKPFEIIDNRGGFKSLRLVTISNAYSVDVNKIKIKNIQSCYVFETTIGKIFLLIVKDKYFIGFEKSKDFILLDTDEIIESMQQNYETEMRKEQHKTEEYSADGLPEQSETMYGYLDISVDNFNLIQEEINKPEFNNYVQKYDYSNNWGAGYKYLIKGQGEERRNMYVILNKDKENGLLVFKNLVCYKIAQERGFFKLIAFGKEGKALSMNLLSWSKICPDDMETN